MSHDNVVTGVVVGVTVGIIATVVTMKSERDRMAAEKSEARTDAHHAGYNDGWRDALSSENHVRNAFVKMFGTEEDPERGTTTKASRK